MAEERTRKTRRKWQRHYAVMATVSPRSNDLADKLNYETSEGTSEGAQKTSYSCAHRGFELQI